MEPTTKQILAERFQKLPKVVQNSILSSQIETKLQNLAKKHNLHLDKWITLENEVMMTLLGIQAIDKLASNISREAEIPMEAAQAIAEDASILVFEPIREELERELHKPDANTGDEEASETSESSETPHSAATTPSSVRTTIEGDPYREALK